jgi:hypothetical protein
MKTLLALLIAITFASCQKDELVTPQQPMVNDAAKGAPANGQKQVHGSVKPSTIDTLGFEVYSCYFDSTHANTLYQSIILRTSSNGDSIVIPCGIDLSHTYKYYTLDTVSNHRLTAFEDSNYIQLSILSTVDTIKYYAKGIYLPIPGTYTYTHIADFVVTSGNTFTRVYENPMFAPYGLSGDHISNNTSPFVNTITIP